MLIANQTGIAVDVYITWSYAVKYIECSVVFALVEELYLEKVPSTGHGAVCPQKSIFPISISLKTE